MIVELITRMFKIRNQAHMQHWLTESLGEHEALDDYYKGVIKLLDTFVETYQGGFGRVENLPDQAKDVKQAIEDEMLWLAQHREEIAKNVPALENLLDDLSDLHMHILYKLTLR
jgi:uncharacterized protein Yka (UPF0111/DUF47 family)